MKKFEYMVLNFKNGNTESTEEFVGERLSVHGRDGWENYAVIPSTQVNGSNTYFFKREILPEVPTQQKQ